MRIAVINPNTSEAMTKTIATAARRVAAGGTAIDAMRASMGPDSIEGPYDVALATVGVLDAIRAAPGFDAAVIACFDDTGLEAARTLTSSPVVGIGEAAFHAASFIAAGFGVITTLTRSVATIENNLVRYGLASRCRRVRAANVGVLDLETHFGEAYERISSTVAVAIRDDRAEAIVLGCAGMARMASRLSREHRVPVVEGVSAAVKQAEALVSMELQTSSSGSYSPPRPKRYSGLLSGFAPTSDASD